MEGSPAPCNDSFLGITHSSGGGADNRLVNEPGTSSRVRAHLSWPIAAVLTVLILSAGLVAVVTFNLQTSADIRKESAESHLLSEMQVALQLVQGRVAEWQFSGSAGEVNPLQSPEVEAAIIEFRDLSDDLLGLIHEHELDEIQELLNAFDAYLAGAALIQPGEDHAPLHQLEEAIRSPLLALLEHENDHLIESVAADEQSENLLRWGLPLLLLATLVVAAFVVRLQAKSRQLDEERRLSEAQSQFIASVSHELRTPLTPVVALAHEMRDRISDFSNEELSEFAGTIAAESAEVSAIVEDLLVAARVETGQLAINPTVLDLEEQVNQALGSVNGLDAVTVEVSGRVYADGGRLRQVLRNLLTNAQRYGGRELKMSSAHSNGRARLVVADSGDGIPEELRERVFEPFTTAHHLGGVPASVGLGLTVSRDLANLMGGSLTYAYADGWSELTLDLPAAPPR